jgi:hypothetical protein
MAQRSCRWAGGAEKLPAAPSPPLAGEVLVRATKVLSRCGLHQKHLHDACDRTTSEMRGLSPKVISGDSRRSMNAQTHTHKHTIPNIKFKLKLL